MHAAVVLCFIGPCVPQDSCFGVVGTEQHPRQSGGLGHGEQERAEGLKSLEGTPGTGGIGKGCVG